MSSKKIMIPALKKNGRGFVSNLISN